MIGKTEEHKNRREKAVETLDRRQELDDMRELLNTDAGIRFFRRFLRDGYIFSSTFTGNSNTFFNEGRRALALQYFSDIVEASPDSINKLIMKQEDSK